MASSLLNATIREQNNVPNKRERLVVQQALTQAATAALAAAEDGTLSGLTASTWDTSDPATINAAIDRLAVAFKALLVKLDDDAGVTDTDYEATLLP